MPNYLKTVTAAHNKVMAGVSAACQRASRSELDPKATLKWFLDDVGARFSSLLLPIAALSQLNYNSAQSGTSERKELLKQGEQALSTLKGAPMSPCSPTRWPRPCRSKASPRCPSRPASRRSIATSSC